PKNKEGRGDVSIGAGPRSRPIALKTTLIIPHRDFDCRTLTGERTRLACMARRLAGPIERPDRSGFALSVAASASRRGTTLGPSVLPREPLDFNAFALARVARHPPGAASGRIFHLP